MQIRRRQPTPGQKPLTEDFRTTRSVKILQRGIANLQLISQNHCGIFLAQETREAQLILMDQKRNMI